jgi:hypothetical protein
VPLSGGLHLLSPCWRWDMAWVRRVEEGHLIDPSAQWQRRSGRWIQQWRRPSKSNVGLSAWSFLPENVQCQGRYHEQLTGTPHCCSSILQCNNSCVTYAAEAWLPYFCKRRKHFLWKAIKS